MGLALAHPAQPPLHHVQRVGLQIDQDTQQPILGRRQRTGLIGGLPAGRARLPIEAPPGHMGLKGGLKRRGQVPKLLQGQTGQIQHLCGAGLKIGEPSRAHGGGLLSLEAQYTIKRD